MTRRWCARSPAARRSSSPSTSSRPSSTIRAPSAASPPPTRSATSTRWAAAPRWRSRSSASPPTSSRSTCSPRCSPACSDACARAALRDRRRSYHRRLRAQGRPRGGGQRRSGAGLVAPQRRARARRWCSPRRSAPASSARPSAPARRREALVAAATAQMIELNDRACAVGLDRGRDLVHRRDRLRAARPPRATSSRPPSSTPSSTPPRCRCSPASLELAAAGVVPGGSKRNLARALDDHRLRRRASTRRAAAARRRADLGRPAALRARGPRRRGGAPPARRGVRALRPPIGQASSRAERAARIRVRADGTSRPW